MTKMFINIIHDDIVMTKTAQIYTRLDYDTLDEIDFLIKEKKYDTRSAFIRRAVIEKLNKEQGKILA